jgi:hypothetical protein
MTPNEIAELVAAEIKNNLKVSMSINRSSGFLGISVNHIATTQLIYKDEIVSESKCTIRLPN